MRIILKRKENVNRMNLVNEPDIKKMFIKKIPDKSK